MSTVPLNQTVARNVARAMEAAGENPSSLARSTGIHRTTLSIKLAGNRPWTTPELEAIAAHYATDPSNLLRG